MGEEEEEEGADQDEEVDEGCASRMLGDVDRVSRLERERAYSRNCHI